MNTPMTHERLKALEEKAKSEEVASKLLVQMLADILQRLAKLETLAEKD